MSLVNTIIDQNQFVLAPSLQMFFINPLTGDPLSSGVITFYRDVDRTPTGLKPVYRIGGTPTAPTFTALPNPITLDINGIFIDPNNGDEILPYYNVIDDQGNIDLYYITIQDNMGNTIETLEHFPSVSSGTPPPTLTSSNTLLPNGQFWSHINLPNNGLIPSADEVTNIAFGGWKFRQTPGSSSVNFVTFSRYNAPSTTPDQNPRYAVEVRCTVVDPADSEKEIFCVIPNVNFMQGQNLTMSFTAYSNDGNNHNVNFIIAKNYGSGGSPTTIEVISTVTVTPQIQNFTIPFTMSSNIGKIINALDGDDIRFTLRSPLSTTSDILFTNIFLVAGNFTALTYPPIDVSQDRAYSLASSFAIPNYDGTQFGQYVQIVPNVISPQTGSPPQSGVSTGYGYTYATPIPPGTHIWSVLPTMPLGPAGFIEWLNEDGSAYAVQTGNTLTAYVNLFNNILSGSTVGTYEFGTGINGFSNLSSFESFPTVPNSYYVVWNRFDIAQPAPNAGTSGFTFTLKQSVNPNVDRQVYLQECIAAGGITPGAYYILPVNTTGPQYLQLFWFTIDGVGTRPVTTADIYTRIDLLSTDTSAQVAAKCQKYANGLFQVPDLRNRLIQGWDNGSYHLFLAAPRVESQYNVASVIAPLFISYITGNALDNIGSQSGEPFLTSADPILSVTSDTRSIYFNGFIKT